MFWPQGRVTVCARCGWGGFFPRTYSALWGLLAGQEGVDSWRLYGCLGRLLMMRGVGCCCMYESHSLCNLLCCALIRTCNRAGC